MDAVVQGFEWLIRFFKGLYQVVDHFFSSLQNGLRFIGGTYEFIISTFHSLPSFLVPFAYITIAVCLTYFIIGRSHS